MYLHPGIYKIVKTLLFGISYCFFISNSTFTVTSSIITRII